MCVFFGLCLALTSCCGRGGCCNEAGCQAKYNQANGITKADWQITGEVKKAIVTDGQLSMSSKRVSVTTNMGVVTISGTVSSRNDMNRIVSLAKAVPGVQSVDNQMSVGS